MAAASPRRNGNDLLVSVAVDALTRHLARHREERLLLGPEWENHGPIAITLDLYSHVTATMQQEAVRAFEGQVGSQEGASEH
jgi:hypothetical protein